MSIAVKQNTKVFVEEEITEGTYVAPAGASSAIQTLADGLEINPTKELLERNVFTGTIGQVTPRVGTNSVSGSIGVEARAYSAQGAAPEFDKLLKSALGTRRQNTTAITTKASGNTGSQLSIDDADISKLNIGDIVMIKQAGAYHVSPILSKTSGAGTATITLLVPKPAGSFSNSVVIAKFTTYTVAESGHPTLSVTKFVDDAIQETAMGCRVSNVSLENFSTGQIPSMSCKFDGIDFGRSLTAPVYTPSYDTALPPIVLDARAYVDGTSIDVNEVTIALENTVGFATSINRKNGKISSRITKRAVSGSINPYKQTDSIANYTKFVTNTEFSLFGYAMNPTAVDGEFENVIAFYLPKCLITELGEADADGLLQEALSFTASRGSSGLSNEIYLSFI